MKCKWYDSRGNIQGTFSRRMTSLRPPIRAKFAIMSQSSFGILWMWLFESCSVFDCLLSDLFVYFKVHIREVKNLLNVKRLGLPQGSSVEPGVTTTHGPA